jgi:hypothetical protein
MTWREVIDREKEMRLLDLEESLEAERLRHQDAAAAYRDGVTLSDRLAEVWEANANDWMEEETEEEARDRMSPEEAEADRQYCERREER